MCKLCEIIYIHFFGSQTQGWNNLVLRNGTKAFLKIIYVHTPNFTIISLFSPLFIAWYWKIREQIQVMFYPKIFRNFWQIIWRFSSKSWTQPFKEEYNFGFRSKKYINGRKFIWNASHPLENWELLLFTFHSGLENQNN